MLWCFAQDQLDDIQRHKATWIWRWACDAQMKVSRDEVAEMVLQGCLAPELDQLWDQGRNKQKLVIQLCDTIAEGSPEDLKVCFRPFIRVQLCDAVAEGSPEDMKVYSTLLTRIMLILWM